MKTIIISIWLSMLGAGVSALFWYNEWKYQLSTPLPENYSAVKNGTIIQLPEQLKFNDGKPVFIHFFNPDCPCSRFKCLIFKN